MKTSEIMQWLLFLQLDERIRDTLIEDKMFGGTMRVDTIAARAIEHIFQLQKDCDKHRETAKRGHWILEDTGIDIIPRTRCSVCNAAFARWVPYYYCPECGSMMDEGMSE